MSQFDDELFDDGQWDGPTAEDPTEAPDTSLLLVKLTVLEKPLCHLKVLR